MEKIEQKVLINLLKSNSFLVEFTEHIDKLPAFIFKRVVLPTKTNRDLIIECYEMEGYSALDFFNENFDNEFNVEISLLDNIGDKLKIYQYRCKPVSVEPPVLNYNLDEVLNVTIIFAVLK